ncbi:MAG TPA: choice-of-anchor Q domain-containing protein [Rudaea sp.]|nr:choice-of-anchor Q domain-containing protein [Rudaea sp.]
MISSRQHASRAVVPESPAALLANLRRLPLALGAAFWTLSAPPLFAATWTVADCSSGTSGDVASKTGSLRFAAANANDGDTIDMSALTCSSISLQTGALALMQREISLRGPGAKKLTLTGQYNGASTNDRLIDHMGTGALSISALTLANGNLVTDSTPARGGCVYTAGVANFYDAVVSQCSATAHQSDARGGGVYAKSGLLLERSTVSGNVAVSTAPGTSRGGGVDSRDSTIQYSTISGNSVSNPGANDVGGGLYLHDGHVLIRESAIVGNSSDHDDGGVAVLVPESYQVDIGDSTISGNSAADVTGGAYIGAALVYLYNSTIAFNTAQTSQRNGSAATFAPGLVVGNLHPGSHTTLYLSSVLLSQNTTGAGENDVSGGTSAATLTITGSNNLVRASGTDVTVPADTLTNVCPLLGPLRFDGSLTPTHALLTGSPAIDTGRTQFGGLSYDQRGSANTNGVYSDGRISGSSADIGAYEVQQIDIVFNSGFDGC